MLSTRVAWQVRSGAAAIPSRGRANPRRGIGVRTRCGAQREWKKVGGTLHQLFCRRDRIVEMRERSIELLLVDSFQNFADARPGLHAQCEQMTPEKNRLRRPMLDAERLGALEKPVHRLAVEYPRLSAEAVGLGKPRQQFEIDF